MKNKKHVFTRYLVIKVQIEVDLTNTDQQINEHKEEILDQVVAELDYTVTFNNKVEAGDGATAIEVPVIIIGTEVEGLLTENPV